MASEGHKLSLLNGEPSSNQKSKNNCGKCGEEVSMSSASSYYKSEVGYLAHKICHEALSRINHPFHRDHPLRLEALPVLTSPLICDLCNETCKFSAYCCRLCRFVSHIKCALFTYNIFAQNNFEEYLDRIIITSPHQKQVQMPLSECLVCSEPLENLPPIPPSNPNCLFSLHKKCAELPLQLNHEQHAQHPLLLQFNADQGICCKVCRETNPRGFWYCCSPCKYVVHVECVSPSSLPIIEDKISHPHPFMLLQRRIPFICDACGTRGRNWDAYTCHTCNIMVHKKCISLPRIIKSKWHDHPLFHKYFLDEEQVGDCVICHDEVNEDHGSYSCSDCKTIFHVNCVKKYGYEIISLEELSDVNVNSFICVKTNDAGEAIEIKHINHMHNLMLRSDNKVDCDKCCAGCLLPISVPCYDCPLCYNYSLHKACAMLPSMKHLWFHSCRQSLNLVDHSNSIFYCNLCRYWGHGFAYQCDDECQWQVCFRCVIALTPGALTCAGHEHSLLFYNDNGQGQCCGCHSDSYRPFRCKVCDFALCSRCFSLPIRARHKCDQHSLLLTYHENNNYAEYHYCDICEEKRDPSNWFYHCAICDNFAHPHSLLGYFPFLKPSITSYWRCPYCYYSNNKLIFMKKIDDYPRPNCSECGKHCQAEALKCATSSCNFIRHWRCPLLSVK